MFTVYDRSKSDCDEVFGSAAQVSALSVVNEMMTLPRFVSLGRDSLTAQLEASLTKADSEQLARSIAEEQYSDLEKEKIMKELEIKDMMARHRQELADKEATISSVSTHFILALCVRSLLQCCDNTNCGRFMYRHGFLTKGSCDVWTEREVNSFSTSAIYG